MMYKTFFCLVFANFAIFWLLFRRFLRPIFQILQILHRHQGKEIPRIEIELGKRLSILPTTINSLTEQIRKTGDFLSRQKEETEEILESLHEGILAVNPSARVIFANGAACKMMGVQLENFIGETLLSVNCENRELLKKCHELLVYTLQTTESAQYTHAIQGSIFLDLLSEPLARKNGSLLVIQNKTSDYRFIEMGKEFIANASHELRTPITIIQGYAETLQDIPNISKDMREEMVGKIVTTCFRLNKLVHNLLTLADIEHVSRENFSKIDLVGLVENCIQTTLSLHSTAKITFHSELDSIPMEANHYLLELAVMNLLENGVKYSHEVAEIDVTIDVKDGIELRVADRGIGIPEADLPYIFDRFYTADKARSRKKGGAGLGLSIVRTIMEKHHGKVFAASQLGKGSQFILLFSKS